MVVFGKKIKLLDAPGLAEEQGFLGLYDPVRGTIKVDKKAHKSEDELNHTLAHELLHAAFHRLGYKQAISHSLEEIFVESLSTVVIENFSLKLKK